MSHRTSHSIDIWFVHLDSTICMLSGGADRATGPATLSALRLSRFMPAAAVIQLWAASSLSVPRPGVGAMTWGETRGLARFDPANIAYGGAHE